MQSSNMVNTQTFVKLYSKQGGPFNYPSNKMIDHEIAAGMSVDMSKSFYQFTLNFTPDLTKNYETDPEAPPITLQDWYGLDQIIDEPVLNIYLKNKEEQQYTAMNVDLIRNATMRSRGKGQLESITRVNVLMHNLMELSMTTDQKLSQVDSLLSLSDPSTMKLVSSAWVELHKDANINSRYLQPHLRLPMSHVFSLGASTDVDTGKLGAVMTHLELDKLVNNFEVHHKLLMSPVVDPAYNEELEAETKTTADNIFLMLREYSDIESVPWYVGQPIFLSYTDSAVPPVSTTNVKCVITSVEYATDTRQVTVTLSSPCQGTQPFENITIIPFNPTGVVGDFSIETCELVVCENSVSTNANVLAYTTFHTEEYSQGAQNFLQKTFSLPPNCVNTFIMSNDGVNTATPLSKLYSVNKYRLRINQDDVVDRDTNIQILPDGISPDLDKGFTYDGQYWDLLSKTFINSGIPLTNLNLSNLNQDKPFLLIEENQPVFQENEKIFILGCPTPITPSDKLFNVNLDCREVDGVKGTVTDIIVYKQVLNQINL